MPHDVEAPAPTTAERRRLNDEYMRGYRAADRMLGELLKIERRALWDQVNGILDEHAAVTTPAEWDALRRAFLKAESVVRDDPA